VILLLGPLEEVLNHKLFLGIRGSFYQRSLDLWWFFCKSMPRLFVGHKHVICLVIQKKPSVHHLLIGANQAQLVCLDSRPSTLQAGTLEVPCEVGKKQESGTRSRTPLGGWLS
jgi:hypothetical protein